MKMNFKMILFIVSLVALIVFQQKAIMPLVEKVVKSDLFLVDSDDLGGFYPQSNQHTELAFMHCNKYIADEIGSDAAVSFSAKPINAWSIGNYQYVINAEIEVTHNNSNSSIKKYVCRIRYDNGDNAEGIANYDNWSVFGLSGIDEI